LAKKCFGISLDNSLATVNLNKTVKRKK